MALMDYELNELRPANSGYIMNNYTECSNGRCANVTGNYVCKKMF